MFEPDKDEPRYPVFRKIDGRIIPGLTKVATVVVLIVFLVTFALYHVTGNLKHEVEVPIKTTEAAECLQELKYEQAAYEYKKLIERNELLSSKKKPTTAETAEIATNETRITTVMGALIGVEKADYADYAKRAIDKGITEQTTVAQLQELVPKTVIEEQPYMSDFDRAVWICGVPTVLFLVLFWEIHGQSTAANLYAKVRFLKRPKRYYLQQLEEDV